MPSSGSFLRQLSGKKESWNTSSKRWNNKKSLSNSTDYDTSMKQNLEDFNMYGGNGGGMVMRKRVMVVVDHSSHSKHAMIWALTHVVNNGDLLTLLHIIPPSHHSGVERAIISDSSSYSSASSSTSSSSSSSSYLASSLGTLCKACKPEVDVEALVIQGPKLATVLSQVKKLEVSVLVLGQKKPSSVLNCLCVSNSEDFVEQCINNAECMTLGVRKQRRGMGGYLISSRWQKNFWLLA